MIFKIINCLFEIKLDPATRCCTRGGSDHTVSGERSVRDLEVGEDDHVGVGVDQLHADAAVLERGDLPERVVVELDALLVGQVEHLLRELRRGHEGRELAGTAVPVPVGVHAGLGEPAARLLAVARALVAPVGAGGGSAAGDELVAVAIAAASEQAEGEG